MRTIRAVFRNGSIEPLEPINLPENTSLQIAVLDGDDLPAESMASLAEMGDAFQYLNDPREDIYSETDGDAA